MENKKLLKFQNNIRIFLNKQKGHDFRDLFVCSYFILSNQSIKEREIHLKIEGTI